MYLHFQSSSDVETSRKEAILLAKMKHPNVVAYKESFEGKYKSLKYLYLESGNNKGWERSPRSCSPTIHLPPTCPAKPCP